MSIGVVITLITLIIMFHFSIILIKTQAKMSSQQLSHKINDVLNHVGINNDIIKHRRKCYLQTECFAEVYSRTIIKAWACEEVYHFGSQSEGTTTMGINSDKDQLKIPDEVVVITSTKTDHVTEDMYAFHMEKFTNRGYCCLRDISFGNNSKVSIYWNNAFKMHHKHNTSFLKNSFQFFDEAFCEKTEQEGPARYIQSPYGEEINILYGIKCTSWPREVSNTFLLNHDKLIWPSDQLLQDVLQSKCFVVPKGSDNGPDSDIEWRLSFSCGERLLMFDLNIVQIRCYVLMKYVKATFLDNVPDCKGIISSYICKTVLFHTVSQTPKDEWVEDQLLTNFNKCLCNLQMFIDQKNCPHFIMPRNNLLANKLDNTARVRLSEEIQRIIASNWYALFDIKSDNFGTLLRENEFENNFEHEAYIYYNSHRQFICDYMALKKMYMFDLNGYTKYFTSVGSAREDIADIIQYLDIEEINDMRNRIACNIVITSINMLYQLYQNTPISEVRLHHAIQMWASIYKTLVGSIQASADIKGTQELSDNAFQWLLQGMKCTDFASAHLKLAFIFLLIGDVDSTNMLVRDIKKKFDEKNLLPACSCKNPYSTIKVFSKFLQILSKKICIDMIRENIIGCVVYIPEENNACPKELQYEMYKSAFCRKLEGDRETIDWTYFASVPQLEYFYFLKYKLYKRLGMMPKCYQVLKTLSDEVHHRPWLMHHRDTILNLIGQCLEQEGHFDIALVYYYKSLKEEPVYNAAKILICCNLFNQLHNGKYYA
ncbi:hypothetical protein ACF0H5_022972 [Mactra antiquata]